MSPIKTKWFKQKKYDSKNLYAVYYIYNIYIYVYENQYKKYVQYMDA